MEGRPAEKRELKSDGWTFEQFGPGGTSREWTKLAAEPLCPKSKTAQKGGLDGVFQHAYLTYAPARHKCQGKVYVTSPTKTGIMGKDQ